MTRTGHVAARLALPLLLACAALALPPGVPRAAEGGSSEEVVVPGEAATATFAGGCFWCMEPPFDALDGVY